MSEAKDESGPRGEENLHLQEVRHPETAYDRSDLSARGVVSFLIGLAITLVLIHIIGWGFFRYFSHNRLSAAPRSAAIVTPANQTGKMGDPTLRFPAPVLQPDPTADMNKFRAAEEEQLNTYGWVDKNAGIVHIPIERAIDLVAQQGLPTRPQPVLPPRAEFGSGNRTPAGAAGGTEPKGNK
jgi:hypothetical protein